MKNSLPWGGEASHLEGGVEYDKADGIIQFC